MINIQDILPFMKEGWVAMDKSNQWFWYNEKPVIKNESVQWSPQKKHINIEVDLLSEAFDIAPADDWEKSLIQVKGVKR